MKILAFDSTARAASVAVFDGGRALGVYNIDNGFTQSELLLPMAENLLSTLKLSFEDIEILAATTGPGSFTGVRIGASLVKGIAFSKNIPCVPVSTLEALAENIAALDGILVPVMDARRGQVYTAIFKSSCGGAVRITEDSAISLDKLADMLTKYKGERIYLVGDGYEVAKTALTERGIKICPTPPILILENAYSVAKVAYRKYKNGEYTSDIDFSPAYLRLPQAERERLEKINNEKKA